MENNYYVPAQIIENNLKGAVGKANLKLYKMIMMGFFAGMFIAIGAEGSNLAVHTVDNFGLAKTLAGCIFKQGYYDVIDYRCRAVYRKLYDDNSGY